MGKLQYPHLFEPIKLGNRLFKNRIFSAPMGYLNLHGDGHLTEGAAYYYGRKAMSGVASVATFEGIVDGTYGAAHSRHICLDTPDIEPDLARIADAFTSNGAVATMELEHVGMYANRSFADSEAFSEAEDGIYEHSMQGAVYGPVECEVAGRHVKAADEAMIERMITKFIDAAYLAKRVGFGMVLVHAGHGWGLHQYLSPYTNTRKDKWGGSVENRCRILVEIIDGIHRKCGRGFPVEVRISGSEIYDGGYGIDEGIAIAKQLDGHADLIHVSSGNHEVEEVFTMTHPSMFCSDGCEVEFAEAIKKNVSTPVATVGALSDPDLMEEVIASGKADVIECARAIQAEPNFVNLIRAGRAEDARRCFRCLYCFSQELTHGEPYCAINPTSGREVEATFAFPAPKAKRKVLVVGGGVGGMQAALTAAERGHEVVLCEKESVLGGVMRHEECVDFKKGISFYLDQQERFVRNNPSIEVRLNTKVTPELADEIAPDAMIVAVGAKPSIPAIPGIDSPHVFGILDGYDRLEELGNKIAIIGGGLSGVEMGIYLRGLGKDVTVIARHGIKDGGNQLHMIGIKIEVQKRSVKILTDTATKAVLADGVVCVGKDGSEVFVEADSVINATGMTPRHDEVAALRECAPEFHVIGDCVMPRNIGDAVREGYKAAMLVGTF